jgi:hypothetical protein
VDKWSHTTSHDELLKVRFFLPFLLSSHFFNPFFSSLLLSSFNFFFSPLYFSFNFSSPLFFSSSLYCKSLQRTAKGNHDSKCYDNKWAFPVGHKKKIRDGDQVLGHIDFWASTSRHIHPYSPFAMESLRVKCKHREEWLDWQASDLRLEEAGCCINHSNRVFKNYRRKSWKENFLQ